MTIQKHLFKVLPVLLAGLVALLFFYGRNARRPVNRGIVVSDDDLNLGHVWMSDSITREIELTNPTAESVRILGFRSSCACTSIEPQSLVIPANGTAPITLKLDVTPRRLKQPESRIVPFAVRFAPVFQTLDGPHPGWTVQCGVRNAFTVAPYALTFGGADAVDPGVECKPKELIVKCNYPGLTIVATVPPSFGFAEVRCLSEDETTSTWAVYVTPSSDLPRGPFEFRAQLSATDRDGNATGHTSVPVRGEVFGDVEALPPVVRFGSSERGHSKTQDLLIRSISGMILTIGEPETECNWLRVSRLPADDHGGVRLSISIEVRELGFHTGEIAFPIQGHDVPLKVQVTYYGTQ